MEPEQLDTAEVQTNTDPWYMPPFKNSVVLADGTELAGKASLNEDAGDLWVWIEENDDIVTVFSIFSNPEKTNTITSHTSILLTETWEGYTKIHSIQQDKKNISICMRLP